MTKNRRGALRATLYGGLIAATIDIGSAVVISGHSARHILQTIAGGVLGKPTFSGGLSSALLGLGLQELMGLIIAAIYVIGIGFAPAWRSRWIVGGLVYGVVIFGVMNYVVLPLCAWHVVPHFSVAKFLENLGAMLLFGLIIAFFAARSRG
jgi:hypothetical protein